MSVGVTHEEAIRVIHSFVGVHDAKYRTSAAFNIMKTKQPEVVAPLRVSTAEARKIRDLLACGRCNTCSEVQPNFL